MAGWTFLTNHARVLLCIARDPDVRHRDLALQVGITERAAQRIVSDLVEQGYVVRSREGRRNRYAVQDQLPMRHPMDEEHAIGEVLAVMQEHGLPADPG